MKTTRTPRILIAGLLAIAASLNLYGGGGSQAAPSGTGTVDRSNFNALGTFPLVKQKETLTIMVGVSNLSTDMEKNWMTSYYEDKTNVRVNWVYAPAEQIKERVNLALAGGDDIDLILSGGFTTTEQLRLAEQGLLTPLQDYIESDTVYMKRNLDSVPGWRNAITHPDGNIYAIPSYNECLHCMYYTKMWVNREFLGNLNLKVPTTPAEFRDMLLAFKNRDANGNGDPNDEIPFAGAYNGFADYSIKVDPYLMSAFVYDDGENRLYLENGTVTAAFQKREFQEGLRYLRQLYSEGLIYPASFTQSWETRHQLNSQKYESVIGVMPNAHYINLGGREEGEPTRWLEYEPIPPLKGPNGLQVTRYNYAAKFELTGKYIPAASKKAALVLRFLDWFGTEEGATVVVFGGKGIGWDSADPGTLGIDGNPATFKVIQIHPSNPYYGIAKWGQGFPNFRTAAYRAGEQSPGDMMASDGSGAEKFLYTKTLENYVPYGNQDLVIPPLYYSAEEASELALLATNINTYVEESIAKFVTGELNIDSGWNGFQNNLKNLGIDRYLQIIQTAYNKSAFAR